MNEWGAPAPVCWGLCGTPQGVVLNSQRRENIVRTPSESVNYKKQYMNWPPLQIGN